MKSLFIDGITLHLLENKRDNILWINGFLKFFLKEKVAYLVGKLIDNFGKSSSGFLQDDALIEQVMVESVYHLKCDLDFLRVYIWFIIESLFRASGPEGLHPLLLENPLEESSLVALTKMDLAVTYRCNNKCFFCYAGCPKVTAELTTKEWKSVLDKIKVLGVPSVNFTGGEPTLRKDLVDLVAYCKNGVVTGITSNGRLLTSSLCSSLKKSGLGYIQVTLNAFEEVHESLTGIKGSWLETINGIKEGIASGLTITTNTTLLRENYLDITDFIYFIYSLGVRTINFNGLFRDSKGELDRFDSRVLSYSELRGILKTVNVTSRGLEGLRVNWLGPVCYKRLNLVELGFGEKSCSACLSGMTVESDGRVIPCQSWIHEGCGNILLDSWETINSSELVTRVRLGHIIGECRECEFVSSCRGACPLERGWLNS